jgi:hypothetical protein
MKFNIATRKYGIVEIDAEFIKIPGFTDLNFVIHKAFTDGLIQSDTLLSVSHFETGYTVMADSFDNEAAAKVAAQGTLNKYRDILHDTIAKKEQINFLNAPASITPDTCRICEQPPFPGEMLEDGVCLFCSLPF